MLLSSLLLLFQPLSLLFQVGAISQPEFIMNTTGSFQSAAAYRQLGQIYMVRSNPGSLVAGLKYDAIGTSAGITRVSNNLAQLSSSLGTIPSNPNLLALPNFIVPLVIIYNLPGFDTLTNINLPYNVAAQIYLGEITMWNDPRIADYNDGIVLPNQPIKVMVSSDTSGGTTLAIRKAFAATYPTWNYTAPADGWPAGYFKQVSSTVALAAEVQANQYSIGYSSYDYAVAVSIPYAAIINSQGKRILPSEKKSLPEILDQVAEISSTSRGVFIDGILNANTPNAYPYLAVYYAIVPLVSQDNCRVRREALRFYFWTLKNPQAAEIITLANYNPLPASLYPTMLAVAQNSTCGGLTQYGVSPCDVGCKGGTCFAAGTLFNPPEDICDCDLAHVNILKKDCSEKPVPAPGASAQTISVSQGVEFVMPFSGASQTQSLFSQMSVSYPIRPMRGKLTAGFTYSGDGSGAGIREVLAGNALMSSSLNVLPTGNFHKLVTIPQFIGSVVMVYNRASFPGVKAGQNLVFPYDLCVKIYERKVTMWNDPIIEAANPGITLPNKKIILVAGSDTGGGASSAMRTVFNIIDPNWNATKATDPWPHVDILVSNSIELISSVIMTPYAIGYAGLETAIATGCAYAVIQNKAGNKVVPSVDSINEPFKIAYGPKLIDRANNLIGGIFAMTESPMSYPYSFFYYEIVAKSTAGTALQCRKMRETLRFMYWSITSPSAHLLIQNQGFVPMPDYTYKDLVDLLKTVTCNNQTLFGASPCDAGCVDGSCDVDLLWNPPEDICKCNLNSINSKSTNCSEQRPAAFVTASEPLGSSAIALSGLFCVYTLIVIILIFYYRNLPLIKALSPIFCIITLVGLMFEFIGVFLLVGQPTALTCSLQMWLLSLPLAIIFAAIIVKQYRLVTVFENKARASIGIKNHHLLLLIFLIVLPCIVFLSLYSGVVDPRPVRTLNQADEYVWMCVPTDRSAETAIFVLLCIYHVIQIAFSILLSIKGRSVRDEFNETKAIGMAVYILATVGVITLIVLAIPQVQFRIHFAVRALGILISSVSFTIILFVKPLRGIREVQKERSRTSATGSASKTGSKSKSKKDTKMKMVMKDGVMVAESSSSGGSGGANPSDSSDGSDPEDGGEILPVKRMKEDVWKWQVYARPQKFLERWRVCNLTFHKELETISVVQKRNLRDKNNVPLCVCFPLKAINLVYRGYSVTGGQQNQMRNALFKALDADKTAEEMEGLVLEMHISNGASYIIQMKGVRHAEQVVGLFTGATLKETETQQQSSSRHGTSGKTHSTHGTSGAGHGGQTKSKHTTDVSDEDQSASTQEQSKSNHARSDPKLQTASAHKHSQSQKQDDEDDNTSESEAQSKDHASSKQA